LKMQSRGARSSDKGRRRKPRKSREEETARVPGPGKDGEYLHQRERIRPLRPPKRCPFNPRPKVKKGKFHCIVQKGWQGYRTKGGGGPGELDHTEVEIPTRKASTLFREGEGSPWGKAVSSLFGGKKEGSDAGVWRKRGQ